MVLVAIVPLVALFAVVVTLSVTSVDPVSAASRAEGGDAIDVRNFHYSPNPLQVRVGTKVTVTNDDATTHTLTAKDGAFDTGELAGGAHTTITLSKAGTYEYFCQIHNYMTGTITVR
jgi:plastocyanin